MVDSNRYDMTAINKTRFGIYSGQFIHEILRMVPRQVYHKLKPYIAENKI